MVDYWPLWCGLWFQAANVNFNVNGGSGSLGSKVISYADAVSAGSVPTRAGYTLAGWNTKADGTGTSIAEGAVLGDAVDSADSNGNLTLYAQWTANSYTVTLNKQSGTGGTASVTATYGSAMPTATMPTRAGYTFAGYYDATSGGTKYYNADGTSARTWNKTAAATLYAQWTANSYTVTLNKQSGSGGSDDVSATYGSAMPAITKPTRTGYTFAGYYDATSGGTKYYNADGTSARTWNKTAATTLYAKWTAKTYTVTLDRQSGSGGTASVSATYGSAMPSAEMPTRTGYTFGGYYTSTGGGGTQYYDADGLSARAWDRSAATTLYAKWTAKTYTVTLNKQSGSGGSSNVTATYGSAMPSATMPTRTGYTFAGYYDATSGGTKYYNADGSSARTWNKTAAATLYALWTANSYTVTLNKQSGSGGSDDVSATYGSAMPAITKPTRAGYAFAGYYDATSGGTKYYNADGTSARTWNKTAATTLYAKWTAKTYTVTLNKQSGTGGTASVTATYGSAMPSAEMPTRTGYAFAGYYDATSGGTKYYNADGTSARTWNKTAAATLYALWTANSYTVTLNKQSGTGGTASVTATYGSAMPSAEMPTRTGYAFAGYYDAASGGTKYYNADGTSARAWDRSAATTLYAKWTAKTYTVKFNKNHADATGTMANQSFTYGVAQNLTANAFVRTGYSFAGWNTKADGTGTNYANGASVSNLTATDGGTVNLYAKWTLNKYNLTLTPGAHITKIYHKINGATSWTAITASTTLQVDYGSTWYAYADAETGYEAYYPDSANPYTRTKGASAESTTFNAKAKKSTLTFDFTKGGGTPSTGKEATYDLAMPTPVNLPSAVTGWTFLGFYDAASGGTKYYNADGTSARAWDKDTTQGTTLYARWTANTYTVTLKKNDGSGDTATTQATYDSAMSTVTPPTRTGYAFTGYYDADGKQYYNADGTSANKWDKTADTDLFAHWEQSGYRINYVYGNGGEGGADSPATATYDTAFGVSAPTRRGYKFAGWCVTSGLNADTAKWGTTATPATAISSAATVCANGESGKVYFKNLTATAGSEVTLTAQWTGRQYEVTFDKNGGTGGATNATMVFGEWVPNIELPTREGYDFLYYYNKSDSYIYYDSDDGSVILTQWLTTDTKLYAKWAAKRAAITFDTDGGTGATSSADRAKYDSAPPAITGLPDKAGYVFGGYYTARNGVGTQYYNEHGTGVGTWKETAADITLYAYWKPVYSVTINTTGGGTATITSPAGWNKQEGGVNKYFAGTGIRIGVVPADGYHAAATYAWEKSGGEYGTGTIDGNNGIWIASLDADTVINVSFERERHSVAVAAKEGHGAAFSSITVSGVTDGKAYDGDTVTVTATLNENYGFKRWETAGGAKTSEAVTYSFTCTADTELYAVATARVRLQLAYPDGTDESEKICRLATEALDGEGYITPAPEIGQTVALTINPYDGATWKLDGWFTNPADETTRMNLGGMRDAALTVSEPISLTAKLARTVYKTIKVYVIEIKTDGSDNVPHGARGDYADMIDIVGGVTPGPVATILSGNGGEGGGGESGEANTEPSVAPFSKIFDGTQYVRIDAADTLPNSDLKFYGYSEVWDTAGVPADEHVKEPRESSVYLNLTDDYKVLYVYYGDARRVKVMAKVAKGEGETAKGEVAAVRSSDSGAAIGGASITAYQGETATFSATARNSYKFHGWYDNSSGMGAAFSTSAEVTIPVEAERIIYAAFIPDTHSVYEWEGSETNKTMEWRSKTYESSKPFSPVGCRVEAREYPVEELSVGMYSSPDGEPTEEAALANIESQDARRLPKMRAERYMELCVKHDEEVDALVVGTSMGGLAV